jgi:shikimate dehydrogenase
VKRFAVVGDPIAHSRSPAMHAAAYRALGMDHEYVAVRATAAELPSVIQALREGTYAGLNVTVPHKRAVLACCDAVHPSAALVGAANTLVRAPDGRIVAHNTDVPALADELRALGPEIDWARARALVLGSGGAARAAIVALVAELRVARVVVRARTDPGALAGEMQRALEAAGLRASLATEPLAPAPATERDLAAIVQCTSAGMTGADPGDVVADNVAWQSLPDAAVALDVVYAPPVTPFLTRARLRGLRCDNGLGMLARQGARAFALWLDVEPPFEAMRSALH